MQPTREEVGLYMFPLPGFPGIHVISRVPPLLHTPLMSATNAISGISLIGSLVVVGELHSWTSIVLGFIAVACSSTNVVGGFLITDRMLAMFKSERDAKSGGHLSQRTFVAGGVAILIVGTALFWLATQAHLFGAVKRLIDPEEVLRYLYIVSAVLFILGLKGLSSPKWARRGMFLAEFGMAVAIIGTLFDSRIKLGGYAWIAAGLLIGSVVGGLMGLRIPMTAVPQRTALSHSLGALAATLVGVAEYLRHREELTGLQMTPLGFQVVIGGLTFTGSLMAGAKLQELLPGRPITYKGQNASNFTLLAVLVGSLIALVVSPSLTPLFFIMVVLGLLFGFLLVVPIGAADMPVVIALLNSYAGLADAAMAFVLMNKIQIITGSLDGTSGFLLSLLMCRAMNRSALNVLFGAFGKIEKEEAGPASEAKGTVRSITPDELAVLFDSARSIIVVPGYGM